MTKPLLSGVVVHWHNEEPLARLRAAWPWDSRFELVIVDNGSEPPVPDEGAGRVLRPGRNLGFAAGANFGARAAQGDLLLLLNPDIEPAPDALAALLAGFAALPEAAGLAPRLVGEDGAAQSAWQLKPLPRPWRVVLEGLFLPAVRGPETEPPPGTRLAQPAAAALALRREVWDQVGGLDEGFYPAWFEDVDLARRLATAGAALYYWPAAQFVHAMGATVPVLGYGRFLWIYYRNRERYLARHHGAGWRWPARLAVVVGMVPRLLLLPVRRPRRAASRTEAARGLLATVAGALSGWRFPSTWAERYRAAVTQSPP
ncbi:MAG: glycosyltransferase family 2 protein [Thermoanaerobaculia bacterium]|nr:glycosyltransferase family 2 protein [Thermoanaerobaculia bacterium]